MKIFPPVRQAASAPPSINEEGATLSPREKFPKDDAWLKMFDWLSSKNPENYVATISTLLSRKVFAKEAWPSLLYYGCSLRGTACTVVIERTEIAGSSSISFEKTICGARFEEGRWVSISLDELTDILENTGYVLPRGSSLVEFCEEYPESPAVWG